MCCDYLFAALFPSFSRPSLGLCRVSGCSQTAVVHLDGALGVLCGEHARVGGSDPFLKHVQDFDVILQRLNNMPVGCARQGCKGLVADGEQFAPACSEACSQQVKIMTHGKGDLDTILGSLGSAFLLSSVQSSSWETYSTGIRHWIRFRLGVQGRHPSQVIAGDPPTLEPDAEECLIRFVCWLSLAGTVSPLVAGGYVSAVKAGHLLWHGYPYEAMTVARFFRLSRVLSGMVKTFKGEKKELRRPILHSHFVKMFRAIDGLQLAAWTVFAVEALFITMWQAILRPDEVVPTAKNKSFPTLKSVKFQDRFGGEVPFSVEYARIASCEFSPNGRKNDTSRQNPPIILAADHAIATRRFSACWQLWRLFNEIDPVVTRLGEYPLFPVKILTRCMKPIAYDLLGNLVNQYMGLAHGVPSSDPQLSGFYPYSLRIGGAVALHDAGADGLVIAALGQWRSDVYQVYIKTARFKAMAWTIRMSRGYEAKL